MQSTLLRNLGITIAAVVFLRAANATQSAIIQQQTLDKVSSADRDAVSAAGPRTSPIDHLQLDHPAELETIGSVGDSNSSDCNFLRACLATRLECLYRGESETGLWEVDCAPCEHVLGAVFISGDGLRNSSCNQSNTLWKLLCDQASISDSRSRRLSSEAKALADIRIDAVDFSRPAQIILIGYGLTRPFPRMTISDFGDDEPAEEERFFLIGGPSAIAALNDSANNNPTLGSDDRKGSPQRRISCLTGLSDFAACWSKNQFHGDSKSRFGVPLSPCEPTIATCTRLITSISFSQNEQRLIIATDDGALHLCFRETGKELCRLIRSEAGVWRVANPAERVNAKLATIEASVCVPNEESEAAGDRWLGISDGFRPQLPPDGDLSRVVPTGTGVSYVHEANIWTHSYYTIPRAFGTRYPNNAMSKGSGEATAEVDSDKAALGCSDKFVTWCRISDLMLHSSTEPTSFLIGGIAR